MEKNIELTFLYDIYGKQLTQKQQEIFELYYLSDLSLREIAQNKGISYQAVRDSIKVSEGMLLDLENNIGMYKLKNKLNLIYHLFLNDNNLD
ncbi:putative DNA-binding protein [compost metagenome]